VAVQVGSPEAPVTVNTAGLDSEALADPGVTVPLVQDRDTVTDIGLLSSKFLFTVKLAETGVMLTVVLPVPVLLDALGSETWSWSTATLAVTVKLWLDGLVQVTDQEAGLAGTVVAVDVGRLVFWTVTGLVEDVVQSPGRVRVRVVSTLVGP
jgi:hypothetical protein